MEKVRSQDKHQLSRLVLWVVVEENLMSALPHPYLCITSAVLKIFLKWIITQWQHLN